MRFTQINVNGFQKINGRIFFHPRFLWNLSHLTEQMYLTKLILNHCFNITITLDNFVQMLRADWYCDILPSR